MCSTKGVDINLFTSIINDDSQYMPFNEESLLNKPLLTEPSKLENNWIEPHQNDSHPSQAHQRCHSRSSLGGSIELPNPEGFYKERNTPTNDELNNHGNSPFPLGSESSCPPVEEEHPAQLQLQKILQTLGLSFEEEEISGLTNRTKERLYGKTKDSGQGLQKTSGSEKPCDGEKRCEPALEIHHSTSTSIPAHPSPATPPAQRPQEKDSRECRQRRRSSPCKQSTERSSHDSKPREISRDKDKRRDRGGCGDAETDERQDGDGSEDTETDKTQDRDPHRDSETDKRQDRHRSGDSGTDKRQDRDNGIDAKTETRWDGDRHRDSETDKWWERDCNRDAETDKWRYRDCNGNAETDKRWDRDRHRDSETDRWWDRGRHRVAETDKWWDREQYRDAETDKGLDRDRSEDSETDQWRHRDRHRDSEIYKRRDRDHYRDSETYKRRDRDRHRDAETDKRWDRDRRRDTKTNKRWNRDRSGDSETDKVKKSSHSHDASLENPDPNSALVLPENSSTQHFQNTTNHGGAINDPSHMNALGATAPYPHLSSCAEAQNPSYPLPDAVSPYPLPDTVSSYHLPETVYSYHPPPVSSHHLPESVSSPATSTPQSRLAGGLYLLNPDLSKSEGQHWSSQRCLQVINITKPIGKEHCLTTLKGAVKYHKHPVINPYFKNRLKQKSRPVTLVRAAEAQAAVASHNLTRAEVPVVATKEKQEEVKVHKEPTEEEIKAKLKEKVLSLLHMLIINCHNNIHCSIIVIYLLFFPNNLLASGIQPEDEAETHYTSARV